MDIEALKDQLILHEGLKLEPYQCTAGKLTIGVGRNIEDIGITEDEARYLLDNDILRVCDELDRNLPWWRDLSDARQRVLVDMVFNLGISRFMQFKNTIAAIESGDYDTASEEMLNSRWADQVGQRAKTLSRMMRDDA
jgi:lysozyme